MKKHTKKPMRAGMALLLLLGLCAHMAHAQPTLFIRSGDYNGDGVQDQLWSGGTPGAPYLYIKRGGSTIVRSYYVGPTYSVANTGIDLNGVAGLEIAYWHPTSESMVIINDRTGATKGYTLGSTGQNAWVQCFNSFTNIDGLAGAEIKVNYYNRCSACKKGYMIVHRNQTTKSTFTCASTTREAGNPGEKEDAEIPEPPNVNDGVAVTYPNGYPETPAVKPEKEQVKLTVAPNPVQNTLTIQTATPDEVITKIVVTDGTGNVFITIMQNNRTVDVSGLRAGIYMVKAETDKKIYTAKFVKQ